MLEVRLLYLGDSSTTLLSLVSSEVFAVPVCLKIKSSCLSQC